MYVPAQISFSYETSAFGPILMTSFQLNYFFKDPMSHSEVLVMRTLTMKFGEDMIKSKVPVFVAYLTLGPAF
jgi:uncharacterized protein YqkB